MSYRPFFPLETKFNIFFIFFLLYRCQAIISGKPPGPGESHGCPFKHFNESHLLSSLTSTYNLNNLDTKEILGYVKSNHFHLACTRVFELQHRVEKGSGIGEGDSVDHPNRYFEASRKLVSCFFFFFFLFFSTTK